MNEFLIQKETLTNIADKFRDYLYEVGDNTHMIDPQFKSTERYLAQGAVNFTFYEEFDAAGYPADEGTYADGSVAGGFTLCDMRENDKGHLVPVIISQGMVDNQEDEVSGYYYVGVDVVESVAYDKWRRIEGVDINTGSAPNPDENYTWESPFRSYLYTNRIVVPVGENITQYNPTDFDIKVDEVYRAGAASVTGEESVLKSYDEGITDFAPLYIQQNVPSTDLDSSYGNVQGVYAWSNFDNKPVGTVTYDIDSVLVNELTNTNLTRAVVKITNNNPYLWATVYVALSHGYGSAIAPSLEYRHIGLTVGPGASISKAVRGTGSLEDYHNWGGNPTYVKWSTTEPVATSEILEE